MNKELAMIKNWKEAGEKELWYILINYCSGSSKPGGLSLMISGHLEWPWE